MAKPLRPKRGTTAKNDAFTGLASEITIDTEKHSIRVHDGVTAGGHEILPKSKNDERYITGEAFVSEKALIQKAIDDAVAELEENISELGKHNVGEEWVSYLGKIPEGGVPYCGQEVTRVTYADLWSYAQAQGLVKTESEWQSWSSSHGGNVPFYSSGDGSSTFRMPAIKGYVKGASSQSEAGGYVAEGLPNITGSVRSGLAAKSGTTGIGGAFGGSTTDSSANGYGSGTQVHITARFDASLSNPIYGNSTHVTPETSIVLFGVYAFGEITNTGALDAETLATGLATVEANKADKTQWVSKYVVLSENTAIGTFTLDLSDYLPTDGDYEVLVKLMLDRSDSSGTNTNFFVIYSGNGIIQAVADGANWQQCHVSGLVPLNRQTGLTYKLGGYSPNIALVELFGYKKVG